MLFTFGFKFIIGKGRGWRVRVKKVVGKKVVFIRPQKPDETTGNCDQFKQRGPYNTAGDPPDDFTLQRVKPKLKTKNSRRIWFIDFEGDSCELTIHSFLPPYDENSSKSEHDVSPPPPEGGGEEGEEEPPEEEEGGGE